MTVEYFQKGGQFPYQAEGLIDNKWYFYFRARGEAISIELFRDKEDLDNLDNTVWYYIREVRSSILSYQTAGKYIRSMYKNLKEEKAFS